MEHLQEILDSGTAPAATALLLGLLTAISPCPLATNITAIGYLSRELGTPRRILSNGIFYALGRIAAYTALGTALILLLRAGAGIFSIERAAGRWSELLLPPVMILAGAAMLFGKRLNIHGRGQTRPESEEKRGGGGAFALGALFAMAFCPTSGILYFGVLIPLAASASGGLILPALYALATALPVIAVAWLLAYGANRLGTFYNRLTAIEHAATRIAALLFITTGVIYAATTYFN